MKQKFALLLVVLIAGSLWGQEKPARKSPSRKAPVAQQEPAVTAEDVKALRDALAAQQQQIQQLRQELQQQAAQSQQAAADAAAKAAAAQQAATQNTDTVTALKTDVTDLKANATTTALSIQEDQKKMSEAVESPIAIHYKGITITPGGFVAAETVYRSHGTFSDINTPMNSIPFNGADQSLLSEFYGSGRQSRISLLAEGKIKSAKLTGYFETDWLGVGTASNNNQSNSYVNRQRQIWGQVAMTNGFTVTGGQMWSLVTETKKGTDNRTEATPLGIDPQYTAGFSWARQFGVRFQKNFQNKVWLALAIENPQTTLTVSGAAANFVVGGPGTGGGLYNQANCVALGAGAAPGTGNCANYSLNYTPDFIAKVAFEPGFGHYEVFGILSTFRDRVYPNATAATPSAAGAFNSKLTGGGIGVNARIIAKKKVELAFHALGGNGVGRYGDTTQPDVTVRPDGQLTLLKSFQSLGSLEFHLPKWDFYFYGGGEFIGRSWNLNAAGAPVGYGSPLFNNSGCNVEVVPGGSNGFTPANPARCVGQTRSILEGTTGFWFKPYNGPKGRIQFGPQYSYLVRNTWFGITAGQSFQPKAIENMVFTSFRYYLP